MRQKSRIPRKPQGATGNKKSRYYYCYHPYYNWWYWHNQYDWDYDYDYGYDWDYEYDWDDEYDWEWDYSSAPRKPKRSNHLTLEQAYKKGFSDGVLYAKESGCEPVPTPEPTPTPPEKKE